MLPVPKPFVHAALLVPLAAGVLSSVARADTFAPWLTQIGISDAVMSAANRGKGQLLGIVDTGIAPSPVFVSGQIAARQSACAAVTFRCGEGFIDDHGHGTAVASIAAANRVTTLHFRSGAYAIAPGSYIGVAPNANVLAEKVLNASGQGFSTDVANGIKRAADAGASVINLSLTFGNTADIVNAVNYAAAKGAFIVWAGGNSGQALLAGANTNGLTPEALRRLVLVGSVNATNVASSFSNRPGAGALTTTTHTTTGYAARWVMAPGESILAPSIHAGPNALASWTGTSMSAPLVAGSMLLLQATWPILKTNGATADLLLATATDLGAHGDDATYGNGLINLQTAFQPVGGLAVLQANGSRIAITSLSGAMITSGALGSLRSIQTKLATYTAFDSYTRNFSVNLAGLIRSPNSAPQLNPLPATTNSGPTVLKLRDGSEISYAASATTGGYSAWTNTAGRTVAMGSGVSAQHAHAQALYGDHETARLAARLSMGLASLASGGPLLAYGTELGNTRVAITWSRAANATTTLSTPEPPLPVGSADNLSLGFAHQWSERFATGVTFEALTERHGLLGATYGADAALSFGELNTTRGLGLSAVFDLTADTRLFARAEITNTKADSAGIFAGTSNILARAYGLTLVHDEIFSTDDALALTVRAPLRVFAGDALVLIPSVDPDTGIPRFNRERATLTPAGHEMDYTLTYSREFGRHRSLDAQLSWQRDALNVPNRSDASLGLAWTQRF